MSDELLAPDLLGRLERLQLRTGQRLAGQFSGDHRSQRHGSSLDFADYREYHPGDDFRRIDYNLYARLDQLLLKLYEAEEDITVRLLIDTSASMEAPEKLHLAKRVAAAVGFVSLVRRDVVTVATFPFHGPPPRFSGRGSAPALFAYLLALEPDGPTEFAHAVSDLLGRRSSPGLTVVISDLLTPDWKRAVRRLPARGDQSAVIHLVDERDFSVDLAGDIDVVDRETGQVVPVSASPRDLKALADRVAKWHEEVAEHCRLSGVSHTLIGLDDDLERTLFGSWRREGLLT